MSWVRICHAQECVILVECIVHVITSIVGESDVASFVCHVSRALLTSFVYHIILTQAEILCDHIILTQVGS